MLLLLENSNRTQQADGDNRPDRGQLLIEPSSESAWILYTVIGACVLISLIALVVLYDLCSRYREFRGQQILDGGPPASPGHHYSYTFAIRADKASPSFDKKQAVFKVELLDHQNQYLTNLAIPCFVFKFKQTDQKSNDSSFQPQQQQDQPNQATKKGTNPLNYKSLTHLHESWANTQRTNPITFYLIRRNPLHDLASVRLSHDCYNANAHILLKYIIIQDDLSHQCAKIDLNNKPIRARHPCPPSGFQVFNAERLLGPHPLEESKSLVQILTKGEILFFVLMYLQITFITCAFAFFVADGIESMRNCLGVGLIVGFISGLIIAIFWLVYILLTRGLSNPWTFKMAWAVVNTVLFIYSILILSSVRSNYTTAGQFTLYFFITFLVALTIMMLSMIAATIVLSFMRFSIQPETLDEPKDREGSSM